MKTVTSGAIGTMIGFQTLVPKNLKKGTKGIDWLGNVVICELSGRACFKFFGFDAKLSEWMANWVDG